MFGRYSPNRFRITFTATFRPFRSRFPSSSFCRLGCRRCKVFWSTNSVPALLIAPAARCRALGWVTAAHATDLTQLYLTYGLLCGVGTGIVYIGVIGLMVRWFPDRRGFATGMVAAGFGFGAIVTTFPIDTMIMNSGYQRTLIVFGSSLGLSARGRTGDAHAGLARWSSDPRTMAAAPQGRARNACCVTRCSGCCL